MKTIWKYTLNIADTQTLEFPVGSEILSAVEQDGKIVMYALVNPNQDEKMIIRVRVYGTGHEVNDEIQSYKFLNSVKFSDTLIMHVFYEIQY
ncbi:hypothetical protein EEL31_09010 [Brevibacillus laterosporus]|nr:hypothetical protein [Brevibacillus laterosporus]TPG68647.1 hypothetical protein EEL31_09010 [Brevibacillus laterosporus]